MLPLEMVYDYDPVPPQPENSRPEPIPEDEELQEGGPSGSEQQANGITVPAEAGADAMSDTQV